MADPLRILSAGLGVQSTAMMLMAEAGEFGDKPDQAVFADTGWEPKATYENLARLMRTARTPIVVVGKGTLRQDAFDASSRFARMPLFIRNAQGQQGKIRRQCTAEYKIEPIQAMVRKMLFEYGRSGNWTPETPKRRIPEGAAELWIGISLDEVERMAPSSVKYITNRWPLIEQGIRRHDCERWLIEHGYPVPPKSACIGCPFHKNSTWRDMRDNRPEEWADAVDFDHRIRLDANFNRASLRGQVYLHRSLRPLDEVDLSNAADHGQDELFGEECSGLCGV